MRFRFPFRRDNRRPDGFWDAPDATGDNIKGTSVDPYDPVWPRWKQTPPDHGEGEFISEEPFFDIDQIMQRADFYPPGRALVDKNLGGNPASRQRIGDMPGGNFSRRRLLVSRRGAPDAASASGTEGPDSNLLLIGQQPPIGATASPAASSFGGFIPGRALPGNAPSAVEPLNPDMREQKRKEAIIAGGGGSFSVATNPSANANAPWYEHLARSTVREHDDQIEQVAKEEGIDADLIRAMMFMETTHGNYGGWGPMADVLGWSDTILPMNLNVRYWGNNFGSRAELNQPLNNIRAGARMLKNIIGNFGSPASIATIATLYNDSTATQVTDYGARVASIYETRPWEQDPDLIDDFLAREPF